jgi:Protein of unknown function (DUF3828)
LRKSFQGAIAGSLVLMGIMASPPQLTTARPIAAPEDVVRGFYSWYLHQLTRENIIPLKQKTTALKYLTAQLYANAPRLTRRMDADIFICAQDWDKGWERNFSVTTPEIKNSTATTTVILPSGELDEVKINVTLIKIASGWRINKVACAN